jgi:hypothetical protein
MTKPTPDTAMNSPSGHPRALVLACLLAPALTLAACAAGDRATAGHWAGTIDTLASGIIHVQSPASGIWNETTAWRIEEELRIGTADGTGPDLFGSIVGLEVDDYGRIYILDRQASELRIFNPDGAHLRTLGRAGSGPGEFKQPTGFALGPNGTLWVVDPNNARYAVFDTTGAYLRGHHRPIGGYFVPWWGGMDDEGRLFDQAFTAAGRVLIRYDAAVAPVDTFSLPTYDGPSFDLREENRGISAGIPYTPYLERYLDTRGFLWHGVTDRYSIVQQRLGGDTIRIVERRAAPVSVSAAEREEAIEGLEWFTNQGGKIDPARIPATKPAFGAITLDDRNFLWVRPATISAEKDRVFDIFDPEGRYLGQLRSPVPLGRTMLIRGDRIYAVVRDELDVPYLIRAHIVGRE